jgi:hypothetical protein
MLGIERLALKIKISPTKDTFPAFVSVLFVKSRIAQARTKLYLTGEC